MRVSEFVDQAFVIEIQQLKDRCSEVMEVNEGFRGVIGEVVGLDEGEASLHAAVNQPDGKDVEE